MASNMNPNRFRSSMSISLLSPIAAMDSAGSVRCLLGDFPTRTDDLRFGLKAG